jgi:hypothetical protein
MPEAETVAVHGFRWLAGAVAGTCLTIVALAARTIGGRKRPRAVQ